MPQSTLEMAKELTMALLQTRSISPDSMQETLQQTYAMLTTLKVQEETGPTTALPAVPPPTGDWRKSISKYSITCLECGHAFKQLSIRHLRTHGLDSRSYRMKYAIPQFQPLAARETSARRRQVVRETRPWEQAPTYRKRHAGEHPQSTEPEAEAVQDETEEPSAAAQARPKRQRQTTTQKKAARKKRAAG
jgi:predicted transcriptional regulator